MGLFKKNKVGEMAPKEETQIDLDEIIERENPFFGGPLIQRGKTPDENAQKITIFITDTNLRGNNGDRAHEVSVLRRLLESKNVISVYTMTTEGSCEKYSKIYTKQDGEKTIHVIGDYRGIASEEELKKFDEEFGAIVLNIRYDNVRQFLTEFAKYSNATGLNFRLKNAYESIEFARRIESRVAEIEKTEIEEKNNEPPKVQPPKIDMEVISNYEAPPPMGESFVEEMLAENDKEVEKIINSGKSDVTLEIRSKPEIDVTKAKRTENVI